LVRPRTAYPGAPEDLIVTTDSATLVDWHLRKFSYDEALHRRLMEVAGPRALIESFPGWIRPSPFARIRPKKSLATAVAR